MRFGSGNADEIKELQRQVTELQGAVRTLVGVLLNHHAIGTRAMSNSFGEILPALHPFAPESPLALANRQIAVSR